MPPTRNCTTARLSWSSRNFARSARSMRVGDRPGRADPGVDGARVVVGARVRLACRPGSTSPPRTARRDRRACRCSRSARSGARARASPSRDTRHARPWSRARTADRPRTRRAARGRGDRPTPRADRRARRGTAWSSARTTPTFPTVAANAMSSTTTRPWSLSARGKQARRREPQLRDRHAHTIPFTPVAYFGQCIVDAQPSCR